MYYEEKIINDILCYRHSPNGKWMEFTKAKLTSKIQALKLELLKAQQQNDKLNHAVLN